EDVAPITSIEEHQSQHISRSESNRYAREKLMKKTKQTGENTKSSLSSNEKGAASVFTPVPLLITSGLRGGKILGRHIRRGVNLVLFFIYNNG
ncbi:unnamed protein product, partial [Didymodactylos carnosus]